MLLQVARERRPSLVAVGSRDLAGVMCTIPESVFMKIVPASRGPVPVCPHTDWGIKRSQDRREEEGQVEDPADHQVPGVEIRPPA